MKIKCVSVGILGTNCYIVENDGFSAVIDPGENPSLIQKVIEQTLSQPLTHIILTHGHFDHVGALNDIHKLHPEAVVAISEKTSISTQNVQHQAKYILGNYYNGTCFGLKDFEIPKPTLLLKDGDKIGPFKVLYTPGHTADSICLYMKRESGTNGILFSGDTLFSGSYGRTDLGGSFEDIKISLERILALPKDTIVFPGHGESTTIEDEQYLL